MGAWGAAPFDNDDALDWVAALVKANDAALLTTALRAVLDAGDVPDADVCSVAVAAAALIHAAAHEPVRKLPDELRGWVRAAGFVPDRALLALAVDALRRITADSELAALWQESGELRRWQRSIDALVSGMTAAQQAPLPQRTAKPPAAPRLLYKLIESIGPDDHGPSRARLATQLAGLPDVDAALPGTVNEPPLCLVAKRGLLPEAILLLDRGADPDRASGLGYPPLVYAASRGHAAMVELLFARGVTVYAEQHRHRRTRVRVDPADPDAEVYRYALGLFSAATAPNAVETLETYARNGIPLQQLDLNGETLLHKAAERGTCDAIRWLVAQGLAVNAAKPAGTTPLHYAARAGRLEAVRCLLALGADPDATDTIDGTPLDAVEEAGSELAQLLRSARSG